MEYNNLQRNFLQLNKMFSDELVDVEERYKKALKDSLKFVNLLLEFKKKEADYKIKLETVRSELDEFYYDLSAPKEMPDMTQDMKAIVSCSLFFCYNKYGVHLMFYQGIRRSR